MMITSEKIEEWLKEIEQRPESAPLIIQAIADRLRDLASWNESLRAENLALISGKRVEEYERRITHLEYQLNLLRRQIGGEPGLAEGEGAAPVVSPETTSLLIYDALGRVMRIMIDPSRLEDGAILGRLEGELFLDGEPLRLLVVPSTEEVLFAFTYGRVAAHPVERLEQKAPGDTWEWKLAPVPEALRSRERLACLTPVGRLPLVEFFLQVSRRGYVKKITTSMADTILSQHYIGAGTVLPVDKVFETLLCGKESQIILLSHQGYLLKLEAGRLSFSIDEAMRLNSTDHLATALVCEKDKNIFVMTQIGKAVTLDSEELVTAASLKIKGQPIFSSQRRSAGVRVAGAAVVGEKDWAVALHADGNISLHAVSTLLGRGTLPVEGELLGFSAFAV